MRSGMVQAKQTTVQCLGFLKKARAIFSKSDILLKTNQLEDGRCKGRFQVKLKAFREMLFDKTYNIN